MRLDLFGFLLLYICWYRRWHLFQDGPNLALQRLVSSEMPNAWYYIIMSSLAETFASNYCQPWPRGMAIYFPMPISRYCRSIIRYSYGYINRKSSPCRRGDRHCVVVVSWFVPDNGTTCSTLAMPLHGSPHALDDQCMRQVWRDDVFPESLFLQKLEHFER